MLDQINQNPYFCCFEILSLFFGIFFLFLIIVLGVLFYFILYSYSLQEKRLLLIDNFFTYVNICQCKLLKLKTTTYGSLLKVTLTHAQYRDNNKHIISLP